MIDPTGITAALSSAKTIYDLVKGANDAQLAMKISGEVANLQGRLIEVQQHTLALQSENHNLQEEVRQLKANLAETTEADPCPKCRKRGWEVISSRPDPVFGRIGKNRREYKCTFCGFTESKVDA